MQLTESFFDTGEVKLHVVEGPDAGPPLVLLHGAMGDWHAWESLMPALSQRWHVYALELRGHGQSGRAPDPAGYHVTANVRDTVAFLRERAGSPAVLVGHSWGGLIALLTGAPGKAYLRGLVLEDPPLLVRRPTTENKAFIDFFTWVYGIKQTARSVDDMRAALASLNPGVSDDAVMPHAQRLFAVDPAFLLAILPGHNPVAGIDFAREIEGIACPIVLMQADAAKGAALLQEDADFVLQHAPHTRLVRFDTGHGIHEEQTEEFLREIDYLSPHSPSL